MLRRKTWNSNFYQVEFPTFQNYLCPVFGELKRGRFLSLNHSHGTVMISGKEKCPTLQNYLCHLFIELKKYFSCLKIMQLFLFNI